MGRLKSLPSRLAPAPSRLGSTDKTGDRYQRRDAENAWRAWYYTARWQKLRKQVWIRDGYVCQKTGAVLTGKYPAPNSPVADHIEPHRGDEHLFWDPANLQTVSKEYHDGAKQRQERGRGTGYPAGGGGV